VGKIANGEEMIKDGKGGREEGGGGVGEEG